MGFHNCAVDQIKAVARFRGQPIENPLPDAASRSTVEAVVSHCVRSIPFGQISPRHPCPQHVKYRFNDPAIVGARALSSFRHQWLQKSPILIAQIKSHDPPPLTVNHDHSGFSRNYVATYPNSSTMKCSDGGEILRLPQALFERCSIRSTQNDACTQSCHHGQLFVVCALKAAAEFKVKTLYRDEITRCSHLFSVGTKHPSGLGRRAI
jgi:hypothetical protein